MTDDKSDGRILYGRDKHPQADDPDPDREAAAKAAFEQQWEKKREEILEAYGDLLE